MWHWTRALVRIVATVHHRVHIGISQNHVSRGRRPPSMTWSMTLYQEGWAGNGVSQQAEIRKPTLQGCIFNTAALGDIKAESWAGRFGRYRNVVCRRVVGKGNVALTFAKTIGAARRPLCKLPRGEGA